MIIFHEAREVNFAFYLGLGLIILSVFLQTLSVLRAKKIQPAEIPVLNNEIPLNSEKY